MGNGGSAAQASHLAAELIHEGLPAIALNADTSVITSIANDFNFEFIFSDQIDALGKKGDILVGLSTSGKSINILKAYDVAKTKGIQIIDFPRRGPTPRCQEFQLRQLHKVWEYIKE